MKLGGGAMTKYTIFIDDHKIGYAFSGETEDRFKKDFAENHAMVDWWRVKLVRWSGKLR